MAMKKYQNYTHSRQSSRHERIDKLKHGMPVTREYCRLSFGITAMAPLSVVYVYCQICLANESTARLT